ncbi:ArsR/SmtB family transcription factor [Clostridium cellulovorans]|uniref:Transcriptional regulator, ArsR family n=1 Tax=Clostridium cellulovorans (strain ATCC 35296 / DSM 3052 / OCM 3 / 743B) TaxID=573061 RepID=D9SRT0_CLOC7|nr:metalloregulator ArsR/SmtB family transcription factor [Clostridium cellulovorans]ADL50447.1 transcriptional regulator, ArsR family [Clostridium cellulovorans 743B]
MDKDFNNYQDEAELLKALAHPVRICIVKGLLEKGECNVSFMTDCLDMPQSTISQHLQKLRTCGILKAKRQGLEVIYSIKDERIAKIIKALFD